MKVRSCGLPRDEVKRCSSKNSIFRGKYSEEGDDVSITKFRERGRPTDSSHNLVKQRTTNVLGAHVCVPTMYVAFWYVRVC